MSQTDVLEPSDSFESNKPVQKRRVVNAIWQPFLHFKLLMYMLGTTAIVAILLGAFLYFAFSDLIAVVTSQTDETSYYGEMIEIQLVHLFRYCGALFVLYIVLLAAVCVAYTHRLVGPIRPFGRQVDSLAQGDYSARITLRRGDLDLYTEFAEKLNHLAVNLETKERHR